MVKEFWVDVQGRPTRLRQTYYETDEPLDAGSGSGGEGSDVHSATATPSRPSENFTFSGFGEPNVITPPVLPTPTPALTPHPACPVDNPGCPVFHTWPPFTLTYETDGDAIWEDGVNKAGREVKRLVWNSNRDWRIDTLSADDIVLSFMTMNTTGSYEIFKDGIHTAYDASDGSLTTEDVEDTLIVADGIFLDILYTGHNLPGRTDGDLVVLDIFQCDGDGCDSGVGRTTRASGDPPFTYGRQFEEFGDVVFSEDEYRIPLLFPDANIEVTELRTNYIATPTPGPTPTPIPTPTPREER